jgi:hypothetical protein
VTGDGLSNASPVAGGLVAAFSYFCAMPRSAVFNGLRYLVVVPQEDGRYTVSFHLPVPGEPDHLDVPLKKLPDMTRFEIEFLYGHAYDLEKIMW